MRLAFAGGFWFVRAMEEQLQKFRDQIDAIDNQLIALLKERIEVVKQVGKLKDGHEKRDCHARPGREGRMQRRIYETFKDSDFNPLAATAMWRQIIGASTHLESPLRIATLQIEQAHTLYWHSRAYFGFFSDVTECADARQVFEKVQSGECNIAVLPVVAGESTWPALLADYPDLKIFAHIPFLKRTDLRSQPCALAIANVPMEESDSDVSCFVDDKGGYHEVEGFVTEREAMRYIGTYPTPVEIA